MIRIGDDVQIVVKEIRKNQVRIGIVAPREVKIYREEVYQNIAAENRQAAEGVDTPDKVAAEPTKPEAPAEPVSAQPTPAEESGG